MTGQRATPQDRTLGSPERLHSFGHGSVRRGMRDTSTRPSEATKQPRSTYVSPRGGDLDLSGQERSPQRSFGSGKPSPARPLPGSRWSTPTRGGSMPPLAPCWRKLRGKSPARGRRRGDPRPGPRCPEGDGRTGRTSPQCRRGHVGREGSGVDTCGDHETGVPVSGSPGSVRDRPPCAICGEPAEHLDHITPIARGGHRPPHEPAAAPRAPRPAHPAGGPSATPRGRRKLRGVVRNRPSGCVMPRHPGVHPVDAVDSARPEVPRHRTGPRTAARRAPSPQGNTPPGRIREEHGG